MRMRTRNVLRFMVAGLMVALLCSVHGGGHSAKWRRLAKTKVPVVVKAIDFGQGSVLEAGKMLMWGEWVVSLRPDSLPRLKPYAPVPAYAGKAFAIDGLQAYSNGHGAARAEIIYDGRRGHKSWGVDVWQPRPGDGGAPLFHTSFYITGPVDIVLGE